MKQDFVIFYSPGTFVDEVTTLPIDTWDIQKAVGMATEITERYGAVPFAFRFITKGRGLLDLDSRITQQSCAYYLGGRIETYQEIEARGDERDAILLSNMRINGLEKVIVNDNSWRTVRPIMDDDTVLDIDFKALIASKHDSENT